MNISAAGMPEEQTELFGHDTAQEMLLDMWNRGKLAGSWLFCGPKGVGKATLAFRLARFVLSQPAGQEDNLFGEPDMPASLNISAENPVFKSVAQRINPGLKVIECALKEEEVKSRQAQIEAGKPLDPEVEKSRKRYDEIRISDIREAEAFLHLTAAANGWRVMIIDAADDMNTNAANALLKSLEEPPPKTVIILISHTPGKLLPTIRSRCRRLTLKPLENNVLEDVLKQAGPDIPAADIHPLVLLAEGSIGYALALAAQNGVRLFTGLAGLFSDFPAFSIPKLYDFTDKTLKEKEAMKTAQDLLIQWLCRACILSKKEDAEEIIPGEKAVVQNILAHLPALDLMDVLSEIEKGFKDQDLDRKQVFINAFFKLQRSAK